MVKITVTFNNESQQGLKSGWGFSCLIESDERILFDTGCSGSDLLYNLDKLDIDVKKIDKIVLSHEHWDHVGGLADVLRLNKNAVVYVPVSFSDNFKEDVKKQAKLVEIDDEQEISSGIYSTGELGSGIREQSLIVKTKKGNLVIVGCSHPGVGIILEKAKIFGRIYGILGGLHGFSNYDLLQAITFIGACHCTQNMDEVRKRFSDQFREILAGDMIEI